MVPGSSYTNNACCGVYSLYIVPILGYLEPQGLVMVRMLG